MKKISIKEDQIIYFNFKETRLFKTRAIFGLINKKAREAGLKSK